ncbi:RPL7 [Symbiodinium microadriaticum]|nr:RPL7 [Symbiodinium microadriaticum]
MAGKVPESFKKKQARDAQLEKASAQFEKDIFARAESYANEYDAMAQNDIDSRRKAKATGQFYIPDEGKVVFVVRVRGTIGVSPKVKKILQLLRLRQINNAVFVRVNAATKQMLNLVEPFIAYGYPSLKSVRELVYKRGFGKVSGQRVPLSSNEVIASALGEHNIVCVEDLIHEIFTVGPNFKAAANFLWPFKLNSPRHGYGGRKKLIHFNEGGACGMQGDKINHLIKRQI